MSDDLPTTFELLVWGNQHPRMLTALARAKLPEGVKVSSGSLRAVVQIPLSVQPEWMELLLGRIERAQLEGDLHVGCLPDRPLKAKQLRDAWASAVRTRNVAVPLTRAEPTMGTDGVTDVSALWLIELFQKSPDPEESMRQTAPLAVLGEREFPRQKSTGCAEYDLKLVDHEGDECVVEDINLCLQDAHWDLTDREWSSCSGFAK